MGQLENWIHLLAKRVAENDDFGSWMRDIEGPNVFDMLMEWEKIAAFVRAIAKRRGIEI
jgi:hypothetical protein